MTNFASTQSIPAATPIRAAGLSKVYGTHQALTNVSVRIEPGEIVGLVGRNGAGKSTLIRALLGLIEVEAGTAWVFDEPALTMSDGVKERLAYVSQTPTALEWMSVKQMMHFIARLYPRLDRDYVNEELRRAQIPIDRKLSALSPGERQQVELVRALATRPELLVLDEPASALDPAARRDLLRDIVGRAGEGGTTVLFSTHIVSDLERVASRILFLHQGRLILDTPVDDLKECVAQVVVPSHALPESSMVGELHRRILADGALSLVLRRSPAEDWPDFARRAGIRTLGIEDLFVEIAQ
jgi:ABC-2 type transport system ATP-binding protein